MSPRTLVFLQLVLVAFLAAAFSEGPNEVFPASLAWPAVYLAAALLYPVWLGFPVLVHRAVGRADLPVWKRWTLAGIEAALAFVVLLAVWPVVS